MKRLLAAFALIGSIAMAAPFADGAQAPSMDMTWAIQGLQQGQPDAAPADTCLRFVQQYYYVQFLRQYGYVRPLPAAFDTKACPAPRPLIDDVGHIVGPRTAIQPPVNEDERREK